MSPIRIGFVGLSAKGWASIAHATPLFDGALKSAYTLSAVSTSSPESAATAAEAYTKRTGKPVKGYSGDATAIASDADVDLVAISVKTPDHRAAALAAIAQKKDVFVEWPLGRTFAETKEIADAARAAGVRTLIGTQGWQSPVVAKVREWLAAGEIGRVLSVTFVTSKPAEIPYYAPFTGASDAYAADPESGAKFVNVFMGHHFAILTRMLGPLTSVSASAAKMWDTISLLGADKEVVGSVPNVSPDHYVVSGPLRDHAGALFSGTWRHGGSADGRPTMTFIIDGDKGYIKVESTGPAAISMHVVSPPSVTLNGKEFPIEDTPFFGNVARNWEAFAKAEPGSWPTFDDALEVYKHVDAIERSVSEGRRVDIV